VFGINNPGDRAPSRLPQHRSQRPLAMLGEEICTRDQRSRFQSPLRDRHSRKNHPGYKIKNIASLRKTLRDVRGDVMGWVRYPPYRTQILAGDVNKRIGESLPHKRFM